DALTIRLRDLSLMAHPTARDTINETVTRIQDLQDRLRHQRGAAGLADELKKEMEELARVARPMPALDNGKTLLDEQGKPVPVSEVPPASNGQAGRALFMEKGCVACHSHDRAVAVDKVNEERFISAATFAPDLSRVANKLPVDDKGAVPRAGRRWLIQWVLNPNLHHPRTRMPVTHLSVKEAAEIADWLLSTKDKAWEPMSVPEPATKTLQELARMSLGKAPGIPRESVDQILDKGLRKALTQAQLRNLAFDADEHLLAEVGAEDRPIDDDHLMRYIGKKAIGRLG